MSKPQIDEFLLFYFPTSFSSQKVLFALFEKEVTFKPLYVSLFSGQHNEPWYMRLNPDGSHIPVLKHGNKVIVEPAAIIDYISKCTENAGHQLVPSLESQLGRNVQEFREMIDSVPADILTYGVIYHPQLSNSGCKIPSATQLSMQENFAKRMSMLTELATKHPDLRDSYLTKSQTTAHKFDIITEEAQVAAQLDSLEPVFMTIENQLKKIKEEGADYSDELWLFGPMFTAADISLSVLLNRLYLLGLDGRYFSTSKCPCIHQYYWQVKKRPAFQRIEKEIANLKMTMLWDSVKTASPYIAGAVTLGAAVGTGYYIYKKLDS
ncbi:ganglioside-induced differentiation-associated protein 1-like [Ruditapes philippinarum]|uniref:ganglioside-induced differentiation-associated protein 1-like n=1 Tax=Ruditapes philippinarum TaxID=129788 RepID=UPI00295AF5B1|nr:ganglioside-induced differentiation-associated protein 1-like [Ruditapes philippinarum]